MTGERSGKDSKLDTGKTTLNIVCVCACVIFVSEIPTSHFLQALVKTQVFYSRLWAFYHPVCWDDCITIAKESLVENISTDYWQYMITLNKLM